MKKENKKEEIKMEIEKGCSTQLTIKAVIFNKEGKILLLKRAKEGVRNAGKYDLPGGWLEEGESAEEVLKREIQEETSLTDIKIGALIRFAEFRNEEGKISKFRGLRYLVNSNEEEVELNPREHSDFKWLDIDKAIEKLDKKDSFEEEKMETLKEAKKYLERETALEGWKRSLAEFENYKKRQVENQKDVIRYATENVIMQIIPVIDNFQASTAHIPEDKKEDGWVTGIMYIQKQLEDVLRENGVEEIELKVGDNFDAKYCEAVLDSCCNKGECGKKEKYQNKIKKVILKGYKIGEKVIRPMRVVVE